MEFAIALRLRDLQIPVTAVRDLLRTLRGFENSVRAMTPGFALPESLREPDAPDLRVVIGDGRYLYVSVAYGGRRPVMFGRIDLRSVDGSERAFAKIEEVPIPAGAGSIGLEGSRHWRLEVSVTSIARDLPLDE